MSDYEDALADLDTAVQEFVRRTGRDQMVSAWVIITQSVTYEGDRPGATVMNYGSSGGTSWATAAGLIRYAARSHDLVIQPGQPEADE